MLQQFQLGIFDTVLSPVIGSICGNNPGYNSLLKIGVAGVTAAIGKALVNTSQGLTGFLYQAASVVFSSSVLNISKLGISAIKDKVENILEQYDMDEYSDFVKPCIDIVSGFFIRKSAGLALEYVDTNSLESFLPQLASSATSIIPAGYVKTKDSTTSQSGFFSQLINAVVNFGSNTVNKSHNFISGALDMTGMNVLFSGLMSLGSAVYNHLTGHNKVNGLSVYDIKKILNAANEIDKNQVKEISAQVFERFKASETYYNNLSNIKPEFQATIDIVTGMLVRNGSDSQKEMMKANISDSKLLEKAYTFIDTSFQSSVISKLTDAKAKYGQIQQINEMGIVLQAQQKAFVKKLAMATLENEVKQFACSSEEADAYKALYSKTTEIDVELQLLSIAYMQEGLE